MFTLKMSIQKMNYFVTEGPERINIIPLAPDGLANDLCNIDFKF